MSIGHSRCQKENEAKRKNTSRRANYVIYFCLKKLYIYCFFHSKYNNKMSTNTLSNDLDNCLISFDRKVLVTNLLDEYGGVLEDIAKTVQEYLSTEEEKGKQFEKTFLVHGREAESNDEVIVLVPESMLQQQTNHLRDVHSMLYSAEIVGNSNSPPMEFVPLKHMAIKLDSLQVKDKPVTATLQVNASATVPNKENKQQNTNTKNTGALGAMFKKQETTIAANKSPKKSPPKKSEQEKKAEKPGAIGAMFKKQEAAASKKSPRVEPEKKKNNALGALFKKQEAAVAEKKSSPETEDKLHSRNKAEVDLKSSFNDSNKKMNKKHTKTPDPKGEKLSKVKDVPAANVSVNLFEESESSDDEEALDALKREVLTDDEREVELSTSNKRRRIIDSDDEDTGPEVKVERKEVKEEEAEAMEVEEEEAPRKAETFLDEDGFIVTKKAKTKQPAKKPNTNAGSVGSVKRRSPISPKAKKEVQSKTPAAKTKQGNIMNFFTKK